MKDAISKRLEALEGRVLQRTPQGSGEARRRMKEHLDRIATLRRDGATVEDNAELATMSAAVRRRLDRGEGVR